MSLNMNRLISSGLTVALSLLVVACSSPHTLDVRVNKDNYKEVIVEDASSVAEPLRIWQHPHWLLVHICRKRQ